MAVAAPSSDVESAADAGADDDSDVPPISSAASEAKAEAEDAAEALRGEDLSSLLEMESCRRRSSVDVTSSLTGFRFGKARSWRGRDDCGGAQEQAASDSERPVSREELNRLFPLLRQRGVNDVSREEKPLPATSPPSQQQPPATKAKRTSHPRNASPYTVLAFVNSSSGGGAGKVLKDDLAKLFGEEQVFDLKSCSRGNMPEDFLEPYAHDPNVRVLACGGDGTMGWIESSLDEVWRRVLGSSSMGLPPRVEDTEYRNHLPLAIVPLGTGNDLSRAYGWGATYQPKKMTGLSLVNRIIEAELAYLDRWRCTVVPLERMDDEARRWVPRMLGESVATSASVAEKSSTETKEQVRHNSILQMERQFEEGGNEEEKNGSSSSSSEEETADEAGGDAEGFATDCGPVQQQIFDGVFCNYFSIGMDAEVAFKFHKWREENPDKAKSQLVNKAVYVKNSPTALVAPKLRDKVRVIVRNRDGVLEELTVPINCRAVLILNIKSYGAGLAMVDHCKSDDGLFELVFLSHKKAYSAAHAQVIPVFKRCKVAARTDYICIRTSEALHCQVDGEPWRQGQGIFRISHHSCRPVLMRTKKRDVPRDEEERD